MALRLAFMGTPSFAVPVLDSIIDTRHEIVAVYSQPPRERGRRGLIARPTPVAERALQLNLPLHTPETLRCEHEQAVFSALGLDVAVVVAYGLLLPPAILSAPKLGCFNAHASLLPRWRGAAPIQRAIMAGDRQTGVMVMRMETGLDTGPIALSETIPIDEEMTAGELEIQLAKIAARLIVLALDQLEAGRLTWHAQSTEGVTYATKITKDETKIIWSEKASVIQKKICGLAPFPGAWTLFNIAGKIERVKILGARLLEEQSHNRVAMDNAQLVVSCGEGKVKLTRLQRAGGKVLDSDDFLRGAPQIFLVDDGVLD